MADRRRFNPPPGGTLPPVFQVSAGQKKQARTRNAATPRKIFLHTGIVPSASGSAYLELQNGIPDLRDSLSNPVSSLKLICTVHGPRPLPRNTPFSSTLVLNTHVKYAPFAARQRKSYIRDPQERDLGAHLETALRGVIIGERWPKCAVEVIVTVLEGEADDTGIGSMNVLAGAITAASAALVDSGIDCVDLITGGVAAVAGSELLIDPCLDESSCSAACVVGYLQSRDEITELWMKGDVGVSPEALIDRAVDAARSARSVLAETIRESTIHKLALADRLKNSASKEDMEMNE